MSTHGLDLPCSFPGKDAKCNQPIRPTGVSLDKSVEPLNRKRSREKRPADYEEEEQWVPRTKKSKEEEEGKNCNKIIEKKKIEHGVNGGRGRGSSSGGKSSQDQELMSLLVACIDAMSLKDMAAIEHCLDKLGALASPMDTSFCRVAAYFVEAIALRVGRVWPHRFSIVAPQENVDGGIALRLLNQATPIVKFLHFTCNEILVRELEGKERVHIIDLDIKEGLQWPGFFHSMATRAHPPLYVRITGIGISKKLLRETGDRLSDFAEALNLPFEFNPVVERLEDLRMWMLHLKEEEAVGVNCVLQLHQVLYNGGILTGFLGVIWSTKPAVVVVAEQEAAHNRTCLEARIYHSLRYYSTIFDMLEYVIGVEESRYRKVLEGMFGREIKNIVACEGVERYERHEEFEKWRRIMVGGGFQCVKIMEREKFQIKMLLQMYNECDEFGVEKQEEDNGEALTLSWMDQRLYSVSAWSPVEVGEGSSNSPSSSHQPR